MNLALLQNVADYLQDTHKLCSLKRKGDNLLLLHLLGKKHIKIYLDMSRGNSGMFVSDEEILGGREFSAPFDLKLAQYTTNAHIHAIKVDGNNRILHIHATQKQHYKQLEFIISIEFTGKHTNVILCDEHWEVIEALRHIPLNKSWREVRVGKPLSPLPQREISRVDSKIPNLSESSPPKSNSPESNPSESNPLAQLQAAYATRYAKLQEGKKQALLKSLESKRSDLHTKLSALPNAQALSTEAASFARYGELLFAQLHTLPTHKITTPTLQLKDLDGKEVILPLPPHARDLSEAGNWYFAQSKKYAKKAKNLHREIENLHDKIEFLDDEIAFITHNESFSDIFRQSLNPKKYENKHEKKREKKSDTSGFEVFFIEGVKIAIGRSAKDNQRLLEIARSEDLWLHIKDVPSAHLIIFCGKSKPASHIIQKAGEILVGLYAARKGGGDFIVDYTKRKFVKLSQNAQVTYAKQQSLGYRI